MFSIYSKRLNISEQLTSIYNYFPNCWKQTIVYDTVVIFLSQNFIYKNVLYCKGFVFFVCLKFMKMKTSVLEQEKKQHLNTQHMEMSL